MVFQKSDDYSFKFYVICCKPFNYSFNRTMQTLQNNCLFFNFKLSHKNSKILKIFWWVAFSRFKSKINFWQIYSILEKMILRTPVLIQQSINFWIFWWKKSGISFRQYFLLENVSKLICSTRGHALYFMFHRIFTLWVSRPSLADLIPLILINYSD